MWDRFYFPTLNSYILSVIQFYLAFSTICHSALSGIQHYLSFSTVWHAGPPVIL